MHAVEFIELLEQETAIALQPLALVNHKHLPSRLLLEDDSKVLGIGDCFVRCDEYVELRSCMSFSGLGMKQFELLDDVAGLLLAVEGHHSQLGSPSLEFTYPVRNGRVWDDDQGRERFELLSDSTEEGRHLDGLAQTHVVSQDARLVVPPIVAQPVEAIHLYRDQPPFRDCINLCLPGTA